jgi:quinol monooxygenase YgiN
MLHPETTGGIIVVVAYRAKTNQDAALRKVIKEHVPILRSLGLATEREPMCAQAKDGTYIEIFEWKSSQAITDAHSNPRVHEMWKEFDAACTYEILGNLEECKNLFAGFSSLSL